MTETEFWYSNPWHNIRIPIHGHNVTYRNKAKEKLEEYLNSPKNHVLPIIIPDEKIRYKIKVERTKYRLKQFYSRHIYLKSRWNVFKYRIKKLFHIKIKFKTLKIRIKDHKRISKGLKVYYHSNVLPILFG